MPERGEEISVGNISGSKGVAIGHQARATVNEGASSADLTRLFELVHERIQARPADPNVDQEELVQTVESIRSEAAKGEQANPSKIERWLKGLAGVAPDIFDVTVASLTSPAAGVAAAVRTLADRVGKQASEG
jgi:hypothetical protein